MLFLKQELNVPTKQDHYLAQVAAEIRRTFSKKPINIQDFILRFIDGHRKPKNTKESSMKFKDRLMRMFGGKG